jgi:hypothetical protein
LCIFLSIAKTISCNVNALGSQTKLSFENDSSCGWLFLTVQNQSIGVIMGKVKSVYITQKQQRVRENSNHFALG